MTCKEPFWSIYEMYTSLEQPLKTSTILQDKHEEVCLHNDGENSLVDLKMNINDKSTQK